MNTELFEKIKKEAEHGDSLAIKCLTYVAINTITINKSSDAIESLRRLAEEGNPDAQRELGIFLDYYCTSLMIVSKLNHEDVTTDLSAKTEEVYYWWEKAAKQGDAFSKIRMEEYRNKKRE